MCMYGQNKLFQNQNWISVFTNKSGIPIKCTDKKFTDYTIPEINKINVQSAKITFKKTKVYYRNQYIYDKRKAFNYKNCQPLWAFENLEKGNKED